MRSRTRRMLMWMGIMMGGAFLNATGCISYMAETAFEAADFSFIFDCDDAVGGTLNLGGFLIDCSEQP